MSKANKAVNNFGKSADGVSAKTVALGTAMGNLAASGIKAVASGLVDVTKAGAGFLAGSVGMAADLEAQMSGVGAVLGASNEELNQLKGLVTDLGIDPNLKVSSLEAAQAIEVLAKNGLDVDDIMGGAARSTVALSNATGANFATAADVATDVMANFNIEADNMGRAVDGIAGVVSNSKFDINDYALAMANAGAITGDYGVSLEDFNTIMAASASAFSSGADAGTSLKTFLQRLVNPTDKIVALMEELNISLFDSAGNTRSMTDVTRDLSVAFAGMTQQQQATTKAQLGGADASRILIGLSKLSGEEFDALSAKVNAQGQATDAAAARVDNFRGAMDILSGVVEAVRLQIGDAFLPVLTNMAQTVSGFVEQNSEPFVKFFERAAMGINEFVTSIQAGQSPIASFIDALAMGGVNRAGLTFVKETIATIQELIGTITAFVSDHAEALKGALAGIGVVLAGAGIAAAIAGIAAAIGAILSPVGLLVIGAAALGAAWNTNWMGIRDITMNVVSTVVPFVQEKITALREWWNQNQEAIKATAMAVWGAIKNYFTGVWNGIVLAFQGFQELFQGNFRGFGEKIGEAWVQIWNSIAQLVGTIWTLVQPHLAVLFQNISSWFSSQDWKQNGTNVIEAIGEALAGFWSVVGPHFSTLWSNITGWFSSQDWQGIALDAVTKIAEGYRELQAKALVALRDFWNAFVDWFNGQDWEQIAFDATTKIIEGLRSVNRFIKETLPQWWQESLSWFSSQDWQSLGRIVVEEIVEGVSAVASLFSSTAKETGEEGGEAFKKIDWHGIGKAIMDGVVSGVKAGGGALMAEMRDLANKALSAAKSALGIASPSKKFMKIGEDVAQGFIKGIMVWSDDAAEAVEKLVDVGGALTSGFTDRFGKEVVSPLKDIADQRQNELADIEKRVTELFGFEDETALRGQLSQLGLRARTGQLTDEQARAVRGLENAYTRAGQATAEYEAQQRKLLAIEEKRAQLNFLQQQLDLIRLVSENQLDTSILSGLELGIGADLGGILTAMAAATDALIAKANQQLGIASPSKVFERIGQQTMQGMAQGVMKAAGAPQLAVAQAEARMIRPPASPQTIINRSQQNNFGPFNIDGGMDMAAVEMMINRALGGGI